MNNSTAANTLASQFAGLNLLQNYNNRTIQGSALMLTSIDLSCAQRATRVHLYESLGSWMRHVPEDKLQVYVERLGVEQFRGQRDGHALPLCQALLRGLAQAMALPNPPKHCWSLLCSVTEKIYSILPDRVQVDPQLSNTKLSMLFFF